MDKTFVLIIVTCLVAFILWWFFGKRNTDVVAAKIYGSEQTVAITVDGGYTPNTITLKQGVAAKLVFLRKDPSSCLEEVVFPDFGIKEKLPVGTPHEIIIDTKQVGEFKYVCGMNMFFGKVVVK